MKLRALRLNGFKSFADRTEIVFHDGITAVVGPNGCGKSNISDAIRWVLGEQRPTAIRGAKMEEAIFQGTIQRRPVNRGSVTMVVSNDEGLLPVPFQEVEIARTVYRDGGSDYGLNRTACRLRDIQEACRDTGLGANAYAVIENRMIDAILSDRADERRGLFEEAAGIGKYKDRRRAAARRLERAELDLQRLEDLIAEVQGKVRSLARQKGRAERHRELRTRRLDVEVAVASGRLGGLEERLRVLGRELEGGAPKEEGLRAAITAAEGRLETLRTERLEAERARTRAAGRAAELRESLVRWERELAVAEERATLGTRRLDQIGVEREEALEQAERAEEGAQALRVRRGELEADLEVARERLAARVSAGTEAREALVRAREAVAGVEGREREIALRVSRLQGDAGAAEARSAELASRVGHLEEELGEARNGLAEILAQGDLFTDRVAGLEAEVGGGKERLASLEVARAEARRRVEEARSAELAARGRHGEKEARAAALRRMERDREGVEPVVQAVLGLGLDGVEGILADAVAADPTLSPVVEAVLGAQLRAVVVRDTSTAIRVVRWFREEWKGGGGLVILPLDRVPNHRGKGKLLDRLSLEGPGAPWARALLDGVDLGGTDPDASAPGMAVRVGEGGGWVERGGVLRVGNPFGPGGLLERRDRLRQLEEEVEAAAAASGDAERERVSADEALAEVERALEAGRIVLRESEDAYRQARAREADRSEQSRRLERAVLELEGRIAQARSGSGTALREAREALALRDQLLAEADGLAAERDEARVRLEAMQEQWEAVQAELSALEVDRTRLEGELARVVERVADLERSREAAQSRVATLEREGEGL